GERAAAAGRIADEARASMAAHVDEGAQLALAIARDQDGDAAVVVAEEVAGRRELAGVADGDGKTPEEDGFFVAQALGVEIFVDGGMLLLSCKVDRALVDLTQHLANLQ